MSDRAPRVWRYAVWPLCPATVGEWGLMPSMSQANEVCNILRMENGGREIYLSRDIALREGMLVNRRLD